MSATKNVLFTTAGLLLLFAPLGLNRASALLTPLLNDAVTMIARFITLP